MTLQNPTNPPLFEIDQPDIYGEFFLKRDVEIAAYLRALEKQHAIVAIYVDDGQPFFLSRILEVDENKKYFFLDLANSEELRRLTDRSPQLTLTATLDKVKIQIRVQNQQSGQVGSQPALKVPLPSNMLRLQRREYFRLETPLSNPLHCKIARQLEDNSSQIFNLKLLDLSGGGVSLMATPSQGEQIAVGAIFPDGRVEIPGDGFLPVNLCVKKITAQENRNGEPYFRIGCEFVNLPGTRLAQIQRYITRIERERKARDAGLN